MSNLIGEEKYFVHKGTWENNYEWRIQKVKVTGLKINQDNEQFAEFSFCSCAYEYPTSWLKDTLDDAKRFAIEQIKEEKSRQLEQIECITEART